MELSRKQLRYERRQHEKQQQRRRSLAGRIALWSAGVIGLAVIVLVMVRVSPSSATPPSGQLAAAVTEQDWVLGNPQAKTVVVEYSDFQCPACALYRPLVERLVEEMGSDIAVVYRHFPLDSIHKQARGAAYAAEAAGRQGKFWEMHDLLFENQKQWAENPNAEDRFVEYARQLGLNEETFAADMDSDAVHEKVERDYQSGLDARVNHTPTFFLNGQELANPRSYDEFRNLVTATPRS